MMHQFPNWLRWIILLPLSIAGGFVAGYLINLVNSSQAEKPDAPIILIADFAGSLASNLVAFYIAHEIAPKYKATVVAILVSFALLASLGAAYIVVVGNQLSGLIGIAGNIVGCVIGWKKYVQGYIGKKRMNELST